MQTEKFYRLVNAISIPFHVVYILYMQLGLFVFVDTPSFTDFLGFVLVPILGWILVYGARWYSTEDRKENLKWFKYYLKYTVLVYTGIAIFFAFNIF